MLRTLERESSFEEIREHDPSDKANQRLRHKRDCNFEGGNPVRLNLAFVVRTWFWPNPYLVGISGGANEKNLDSYET